MARVPLGDMAVEKVATEAKQEELLAKLDRLIDILSANCGVIEESKDDEPQQGASELLESCPFCGNKPLYIVDPVEGIYITCWRCRVRTPGYFDNRVQQTPNAIALARKTWNARCVRDDS